MKSPKAGSYSWGWRALKLLLRGTELRLYAGEIEHSVILSIKKRGEKYWNDKKTLLNDTKKFLKNRPVLVS